MFELEKFELGDSSSPHCLGRDEVIKCPHSPPPLQDQVNPSDHQTTTAPPIVIARIDAIEASKRKSDKTVLANGDDFVGLTQGLVVPLVSPNGVGENICKEGNVVPTEEWAQRNEH